MTQEIERYPRNKKTSVIGEERTSRGHCASRAYAKSFFLSFQQATGIRVAFLFFYSRLLTKV